MIKIRLVTPFDECDENLSESYKSLYPHLSKDAQFAQYLLDGGGNGGPLRNDEFDARCERILREPCKNPRIHLFMSALRRISPTSDQEAHIKVMCAIHAGAEGYDCVMSLAPELIKRSAFEWEQEPNTARWFLKNYLVKVYERRKMYWEALPIMEDLHLERPWQHTYVEGLVRILNHLGAFDSSLSVIEAVRQSTYYKMSGLEYHLDYWNRRFEEYKLKYDEIGFPLDRDRYFSELKLPDPPINLLKYYTDIAELTIGSSIVSARNKSDYEWISQNLPKLCPKSYGGYKRMKNGNTNNYQKLYQACLEKGRDINFSDNFTAQAQKLSEMRAQKEAEYWKQRNSNA